MDKIIALYGGANVGKSTTFYGTGNDAARTDRHPTLEQERLPRHFHGERQKSVHLHMG